MDLAAEQGGNVETTVPGQVVKHGDVTCIGYTDMPSRLPSQSSTLYSNNISKFLLSMGPFTGHKDQFAIDEKDDAVRGALVLEGGEWRWPPPPLNLPVAAAPKKVRRGAARRAGWQGGGGLLWVGGWRLLHSEASTARPLFRAECAQRAQWAGASTRGSAARCGAWDRPSS